MKHLEFFNYKNIFSGFCCGPDDGNFFFYYEFCFFPLSQKLVLMYPRLKFLNKGNKISKKKYFCFLR